MQPNVQVGTFAGTPRRSSTWRGWRVWRLYSKTTDRANPIRISIDMQSHELQIFNFNRWIRLPPTMVENDRYKRGWFWESSLVNIVKVTTNTSHGESEQPVGCRESQPSFQVWQKKHENAEELFVLGSEDIEVSRGKRLGPPDHTISKNIVPKGSGSTRRISKVQIWKKHAFTTQTSRKNTSWNILMHVWWTSLARSTRSKDLGDSIIYTWFMEQIRMSKT